MIILSCYMKTWLFTASLLHFCVITWMFERSHERLNLDVWIAFPNKFLPSRVLIFTGAYFITVRSLYLKLPGVRGELKHMQLVHMLTLSFPNHVTSFVMLYMMQNLPLSSQPYIQPKVIEKRENFRIRVRFGHLTTVHFGQESAFSKHRFGK